MNLLRLENRVVPATVLTGSHGTVREYNAGILVDTFTPFAGYLGPIIGIKAGDDYAFTPAGVAGPHVRVIDGPTRREIGSFYAYDPGFLFGVNLDFDGASVVTGTRQGAPHVRLFTPFGDELESYYAGDPASTEGVSVSLGHLVTPSSVDRFQSKPEASKTIYVEFLVGVTADRLAVLTQVANLYAPYNVNVTNFRPEGPLSIINHVVVGTTPLNDADNHDALGAATRNGFFEQSQYVSKPAYVQDAFRDDASLAVAITHESAHGFGVDHSTDPLSVMFATLSPRANRFDNLSAAILTGRLR
jgi:hypothetical protein